MCQLLDAVMPALPIKRLPSYQSVKPLNRSFYKKSWNSPVGSWAHTITGREENVQWNVLTDFGGGGGTSYPMELPCGGVFLIARFSVVSPFHR